MEIDFSGKVALVTGGTRGIGKQIVKDLLEAGADVIFTGTKPRKDKSYIVVDFSDSGSVNEFINILRSYDKIDILINNAGINRIDYLWDIKLKDWDDIIAVNLKAPLVTAMIISKLMIANGYGRIVNIASISGVVSWEKRCSYTSSKAGLIGLTRSMAVELAPYGILVNSVSPGFTWTEMTRAILTEDEVKRLSSSVPIGRFAETSEISKAVMFLASDLNTYIAGQNLVVDGGYVSG